MNKSSETPLKNLRREAIRTEKGRRIFEKEWKGKGKRKWVMFGLLGSGSRARTSGTKL